MLAPPMGKPSKEEPQGDRLVARHRRAGFDYELGERWEAGIVLIGSEVRALRTGNADLTDGFVWVDRSGEAWAKNLRIPPLQHAAFGHEERRDRKLLLHAREIEAIRSAVERDGMTCIPTRLYFKNGRAKLEVALARGKKKHDKRASVKAREADREARVAMRRTR